jgi:hypothetical protein
MTSKLDKMAIEWLLLRNTQLINKRLVTYSLVQKFGAKESDMQPEQEIIFQLDTSCIYAIG